MDSYQLNAERGIKDVPDIAMPPLPEEPVNQPLEEPTPIEEPAQEESQSTVQSQPVYHQENQNIRELREKAYRSEMLERELQEYKRREQEMRKPAPQEEEDYNINLAPDDLAEGKHLTKVDKKVKKLEEQIRTYQQQTEMLSIESKLKSQYHDFDSIVSQANLNALEYAHPDLFATIQSSNNLYSKAVTAYTMIKQLNIGGTDGLEATRAKAQLNASKPKPVSSIAPQQGQGALSKANAFESGLTEELKKQLIKEMVDARKDR